MYVIKSIFISLLRPNYNLSVCVFSQNSHNKYNTSLCFSLDKITHEIRRSWWPNYNLSVCVFSRNSHNKYNTSLCFSLDKITDDIRRSWWPNFNLSVSVFSRNSHNKYNISLCFSLDKITHDFVVRDFFGKTTSSCYITVDYLVQVSSNQSDNGKNKILTNQSWLSLNFLSFYFYQLYLKLFFLLFIDSTCNWFS